MFVFGPQIADETMMIATHLMQNGAALQELTEHNLFNGTTQFDGFTIIPASGTITGSCRVYGFRNTP
jgi:hypothetical protein